MYKIICLLATACSLYGRMPGQTAPVSLDSAFAHNSIAELDQFLAGWKAYSFSYDRDAHQLSQYIPADLDSSNYFLWMQKNRAIKPGDSPQKKYTCKEIDAAKMKGAEWLIQKQYFSLPATQGDEKKVIATHPLIALELQVAEHCSEKGILAVEYNFLPGFLPPPAYVLDSKYDSILCCFIEKGVNKNSGEDFNHPGKHLSDRIFFLNQRIPVAIDTATWNYENSVSEALTKAMIPYVNNMQRKRPYCSFPELWMIGNTPFITHVKMSADGMRAQIAGSFTGPQYWNYYFNTKRNRWEKVNP